jgi:hypothetical protein
MMFFSRPFRLPILILTFVLVAAYVLREELRPLFEKNWAKVCYFFAVLLLCVWLTPQLYYMYKAKTFVDAYGKGHIESAAEFTHWADRINFTAVGKTEIGGWRFQHDFFIHVAQDIFYEGFDREFAASVLLYAEPFQKRDAFYSMDYAMSQLYYVLGDYEKAMHFSFLAFEKMPLVDKYYAFHHICNVLKKCKEDNRSVIDVLGKEKVGKLLDKKLFHVSQFDEQWHVL